MPTEGLAAQFFVDAGVLLHCTLPGTVISLVRGGPSVDLVKGSFAQDRDQVDVLCQGRPLVQVKIGVATAGLVEALIKATGLLEERRA